MGRLIAKILLVFIVLSCYSTDALKVFGLNHEFVNWTHVADFVFQPQGELSGTASSSSSDTWLLVLDDEKWIRLRSSIDPIVSTCQLKALASSAVRLGHEAKAIQFSVKDFSKFHVFMVDVSPKCTEKILVLKQWRSARRRGPIKVLHRLFNNQFTQILNRHLHHGKSSMSSSTNGEEEGFRPTKVSFNLHLVNPQFGTFREFSSEELLIFPTISAFLLVYTLLLRFQLASARLLWANTGITLASALLMVFFFKWISLLFNWLGLMHYMWHGSEAQSGSHNYKWASLLLDGLFGLGTLALLIATSKGWMITTPSLFADMWTKLQFSALVINAFASVTSLAKFLFPLTENHSTIISDLVVGSSHLLVFLSSYADLVNLARISRHHVGAKPRARAFNVVAALLLIWAITPVLQAASSHVLVFWLEPMVITTCTLALQAFSSVLLAWAFRPELLWELHGERPHAGASHLLTVSGDMKALKRFDDSADELDGLLQV